MRTDQTLAPGGSPGAWAQAIARVVERHVAFDEASRPALALAAGRLTVHAQPTFDTTIEAVLASRRAAGEANDRAPRRGSAPVGAEATRTTRPREWAPASAPLTSSATASAIAPSGRSRTPGIPRPPTRGEHPAAEVQRLPQRIDRPLLEQRVPLPGQAVPGRGARVAPSTPLHVSAEYGHARRQQVARWSRPDEASTPRRARMPRPEPPAGSALASAIERIAAHLGHIPVDRLRAVLQSIPRPGPPAPPATLAPGLSVERDDSGSLPPPRRRTKPGFAPGLDAPPDAGSRSVLDARHGFEPARPQRDGAAPPRSHEITDVFTSPEGPPPAIPLADQAVVRQVTAHQEFPQIRRDERASAPVTSAAAEVDFPDHASLADDDLEHRMKRILDDLARRHGIEV